MEIYIVEDDRTVINILEDIIETNGLGTVCGTSGGQPADMEEIVRLNPDVVLVDFLMPEKDGIQLVRELKEAGCGSRFIMISQVSAKELIGKAYSAGIDFFISKPINIIEVKSVIENVERQIQNERTLSNIRKMFLAEMKEEVPEEKKKKLEEEFETERICARIQEVSIVEREFQKWYEHSTSWFRIQFILSMTREKKRPIVTVTVMNIDDLKRLQEEQNKAPAVQI